MSARTANRRATSSTLRPIGPGLSWLALMGTTPAVGTAPTVGLSPTTPATEHGQTMDPSVSVPTANGVSPAASAAPDPEDEPPALRSSAHGLPTRPPVADHPLVEWAERMLAHSERLVLARTTAPARRTRVTRAASAAGRPARAVEPAAPGSPVASMLSFTITGTPWSGPSASPRARSASRWAATPATAARPTAPSGSSTTVIRSRRASTSPALVRVPVPNPARMSATPRYPSSAVSGWGSMGTTAG